MFGSPRNGATAVARRTRDREDAFYGTSDRLLCAVAVCLTLN